MSVQARTNHNEPEWIQKASCIDHGIECVTNKANTENHICEGLIKKATGNCKLTRLLGLARTRGHPDAMIPIL